MIHGGSFCNHCIEGVSIFAQSTPNADTFYWHHSNRTWEQIPTPTSTPTPTPTSTSTAGGFEARTFHVAVQLGENMFICGGLGTSHAGVSSVWLLHVPTRQWRLLLTGIAAPAALASAAVVGPWSFIVAGGSINFNQTKLVYRYDWNHETQQLNPKQVNLLPGSADVMLDGLALWYYNKTLVTFGGLSTLPTNMMLQLSVGCDAGLYSPDIEQYFCMPCPLGQYEEFTGATKCGGQCPAHLTTPTVGSNSSAACTSCEPSACQHGRCYVMGDLSFACECNFGFQGPQCSEPVLYIVLGVLLGTLLLTAIVIKVVQRLRKRYKYNIELYGRLLEEKEEEIDRLWQISATDLKRIKSIGTGSYGEVFVAKYQGMVVAVKQLRDFHLMLDETSATTFMAEGGVWLFFFSFFCVFL